MLNLRHQGNGLLVIALSCLSIAALPAGSVLSEAGTSEEGQKHRGSGRQTAQEIILSPTAYRGTGRIHPDSMLTAGHRGSGRITDKLTKSQDSAYRGSGRFVSGEQTIEAGPAV